MNICEGMGSLLAQQHQLIEGLRPAQMFPLNSRELPVPDGFDRVETPRGAFHFNPKMVTEDRIRKLSALCRENELLAFGPYNKADVIERESRGEAIVVITERTPDGVEVKAVVGTTSTLPAQIKVIEQTKSPGNIIGIEDAESVLAERKLLGG